jgi:signal-transduction protein with cAMP-binding, CBS, and nucleotidyltransferase domain
MICPVCGFENLQGEDNCENCGADLRTADAPAPGSRFERALLNHPLGSLSPPPATRVAPEMAAADALVKMRGEDSGALIVERDGRVVGIFTERDAVRKLARRSLDGVSVEQVMTADPVVLRTDDSVAVAIHKMAVGGFRHIPVVDGGAAVGMITAHDLFRYILELLA